MKIIGYVMTFFLSIGLLLSQEICNNGIDDDADGFIDSYDSDCVDVPSCTTVPGISEFVIAKTSQTLGLYANGSTPTVGDIDGDGIVEIIVARADDTNLGYDIYEGTDLSQPEASIDLDLHISSIRTSTQPAIADINKDGTAEIITLGRDQHVYVFPHTGGSASNYMLKSDVTTGYQNTIYNPGPPRPADHRISGSPRMVDIDEDGIPEVVVGRSIFQFNSTFTSLNRVVEGSNSLPRGANATWDMDIVVKDILPAFAGKELIVGGKIYSVNLTNGTLTLRKNLLLATNTLGNGTFPSNYIELDGPAAVADVDLDGDLDVVLSVQYITRVVNGNTYINSKRYFLVWDPNTGTDGNILLFEEGTNLAIGVPFICNVYDDTQDGKAVDLPEMVTIQRDGFVSGTSVAGYVVAHNLNYPNNVDAGSQSNTFVWRFPHDDGSSRTTLDAFDFNGDGIKEMVYRDTNQMRIMNGNVNPPVNYTEFPANSATWAEGPVIADIDQDGQAEIVLVSGGADVDYSLNTFYSGTTYTMTGALQVFEAGIDSNGNQTIWQNARPIWNQRGYSYVNINDDLTVPAVEQNPMVEFPAGSGRYDLNIYMAQLNPDGFFLPPLSVPVPDGTITLNSMRVDVNSNITIDYTVFNGGSATLSAGTSVSVYHVANPATDSSSQLITTFLLPEPILKGEDFSSTITINLDTSETQNIYFVLNDNTNQAPSLDLNQLGNESGILECNYQNNVSEIITSYCFNTANTNTAETTEVGISTLERSKNRNTNDWPRNVKSSLLALEAKKKGLVITRIEDPENSITNPVEGMLVFDTDDNCLKLYDGLNWFCIQQGCINN